MTWHCLPGSFQQLVFFYGTNDRSPLLFKHPADTAGFTEITAVLLKAALRSAAVRLRLSVKASISMATPPGP